ncbi:hypothetical protein [Fuscibacter oryzae]|uniref:Uncharacterized protein n=1 Tax=Fuscibacter oryzae TaxID=2803939 RepID=A0A8J7MWZ9_9RHOB|nr:hypothetical protein [Fuscibacter oryzae]MBL4929314.1 hypothetical protein [Fuscibacter oryzae]
MAFTEERLGGGAEPSVIFKIAVKKCQIVFLKPIDGFSVDRNSVKRPKPLTEIELTNHSEEKKHRSISGTLSLGPKPNIGAEAGLSHNSDTSKVLKSVQKMSPFSEQFTFSSEGYEAWNLNGSIRPNGRIIGPVFDHEADPRLTIVDKRSAERKARDDANAMTPVSRIEVRCLREDIDIYDIEFKDEDRQKSFINRSRNKEKLAVARQVLREAILQENLSVGNLIDDPYAEMTICDTTIPIVDQGSSDG